MQERNTEKIIDLKNLPDYIPALIWMADTEKSCYYFNETWLQFTGRTLEQEQGDGWAEGVHPDDLENCYKIYSTQFDKREKFTIEYRLKRQDGIYRWILDSGVPMHNHNSGVFLGYIGTCFDITEKRELEESLIKSQSKFKNLFKDHDAIMILVDSETGKIVDANDSAVKFYGYPYEQICSLNISEINMSHKEEINQEMWKAINHKKTEFIFPHKLSDNQIRYVTVNSSPIEFDQKTVLFSVIQDITEKKKIKEQLQKAHQKTNALINTTKDYIFSVDTHFSVTIANKAFLELLQPAAKNPPFKIGDNIFEDVNTDEAFNCKWLDFYNRGFKGESYCVEDHLLMSELGLDTWNEITVNPIYQDQSIIGAAVFIKDISERKNAEILVTQEKDNFHSILKALPDIVLKIDADYTFTYVHTQQPEILFLPVNEMVGKRIDEIFPGAFCEAVFEQIKQAQQTNSYVMWEHSLEIPNIGPRYFEARLVKAINHSTLAVIRDITENKNKEKEIILANERFKYATKATSDGIYEWDIINDQIYWSDGYKDLFEYDVESNIGDYSFWYNKLDAAYKDTVLSSLHSATNGNATNWVEEYRFKKGNGEYIDVIDRAIIIRDQAGKAIKLVGALSDISLTKKQEQEKIKLEQEKIVLKTFEKSERRYAQLVNSIHDILFTTDNTGNWTFLNHSWETIMEYTVDECLGIPFFNYLHADDVEKNANLFIPLIARKKNYCKHNIRYVSKTGKVIWMEVFAVLIINENDETIGTSGTLRDITKEKRDEHYYNLLSKNSSDFICVYNYDATLLFVSDSIKDILGYAVAEVIGMNIASIIHPKDKHIVEKIMAERIESNYSNDYKKEIIARYKRKDGKYTWVESSIYATFDEYTFDNRLVSSSRVVDKRIKAEKAIFLALKQEKKLNDLKTRFISTASHEFKTPLTVIKSTTELLKRYIEKGKKNIDFSNSFITINTEIDRLTILLNDILILEKVESNKIIYKPIQTNIVELVQMLIAKFKINQEDGRLVEFIYYGTERLIHIDASLIEVIISNLLSNALKYSKGKPNPIICLKLNPKEVIIYVKDFGIGIPASDQEQIFNSFFRASNVDKIEGTGLGLSIVKDFVEIHKGKITFDSMKDNGTEFMIQLPRQ